MAKKPTKEEKQKARASGDRADIIKKALDAIHAKHKLKNGDLSARLLVAEARDEKHPLHTGFGFEWNVNTAAQLHNESVARRLITYVTVTVVARATKVTVPCYVRSPTKSADEQGMMNITDPESIERADATRIMLTELDRCKGAIERARGITHILDRHYPGLADELESCLQQIVHLRKTVEHEYGENSLAPPPA